MTEGRIDPQHPEFVKFMSAQTYSEFLATFGGVSTELTFQSAFDLNPPKFFTNYTENFKAVIDYIFYRGASDADCEVLHVVNRTVLGCQNDVYSYCAEEDYAVNGEVKQHKYAFLPNEKWGSDHLALLVKFALTKRQKNDDNKNNVNNNNDNNNNNVNDNSNNNDNNK